MLRFYQFSVNERSQKSLNMYCLMVYLVNGNIEDLSNLK